MLSVFGCFFFFLTKWYFNELAEAEIEIPHAPSLSIAICTLLPPASEGWGKVMFSVCSHGGGGGYPYPIMLCNITQNAMGQPGGGGGTLPGPAGGRGYSGRGGTLAGGGGVPWLGGGGGTQLGQHREYLLHGG